ncbi:Pentatricopeptide repeat-containing protein [Thalictrum thalictroides]|uniref:Pentatricopeptide repeat-containing protein n=1 Tax=Thalictrum thalictroides TaxID=46969 RepID=A0A7J6WJX9_THATH|nr:Pentatricopeptide repeat-containing protein [Thalictrum thalictroides]
MNNNNNNNCKFVSCDKIDRAANWVGASVATAFFASLERCSCINLSTTDKEEDEEAYDRPLMPTNSSTTVPIDDESPTPTTTATKNHADKLSA